MQYNSYITSSNGNVFSIQLIEQGIINDAQLAKIAVSIRLSMGDPTRNWLLIYDNADQPDELYREDLPTWCHR